MPQRRLSVPTSIALVLIAILAVQFGASLAKGIFPVLGPRGVSAWRLIFASWVLTAVWRPWKVRLSMRELRAVSAYGLALGAMNLSFYMALERLPLGQAVSLEFTGPLAVALLSSRKARDFVWAILAALGIALIIPRDPSALGRDPIGIAYALTAGAAWAFYILMGKKAGSLSHAGLVTTVGMWVAALFVLPFALFDPGTQLWVPQALPTAFAVAVFSSALPYNLEMVALKNLPAKNFGVLMSLEPAVAALIGLLLLGESLNGTQWIAMACIMAASAGSSASTSDASDKPVPVEA